MEVEYAREFARRHHHAVLANGTGADEIQQSPVLVAVDEKGHFVISSREAAFKTKTPRPPRVSARRSAWESRRRGEEAVVCGILGLFAS